MPSIFDHVTLGVSNIETATYALHCNEDAASFYLLWYAIGIGCCGLIGGMAGRRLLGV